MGEPDFCAVLLVQIGNPAKHSPPSKRFEALLIQELHVAFSMRASEKRSVLTLKKGKKKKQLEYQDKRVQSISIECLFTWPLKSSQSGLVFPMKYRWPELSDEWDSSTILRLF